MRQLEHGRTWPRAFALPGGSTVAEARLFGRLPEIELVLSNGVRVLSFVTSSGDPRWTPFDRLQRAGRWLTVEVGALHVDPPYFEEGP